MRAVLALWFGAMLLLGGGLLARHAIALPVSAEARKLSGTLGALRDGSANGRWMAVHVLYSECRCSQRIVAHLVSTQRPTGWHELVLWVGDGEPSPELTARFRVKRVTSTELASLGVEAAPSLVVLDPGNGVRYSGGYTDRKQGPLIEDLRILDDAQHDKKLATLPVFGCAVSDRLKRALSALPSP